MIAKIFALLCLIGLTRAGHLYGGYGGYSGYAAISPYAYSHAPAVSHVSQYTVHSAPVVKSYAPVSYAYSPIVSHAYAAPVAYGYGSYGYRGYGSKYGW